tara:strand:+ start:295 stop:558 length:264 start_codon:yes stop_codon:yes gene_type:complete
MIELLKYLANNLGPEQLLEVADILARNPEMIDQESFMQIINDIEGFEIHEIDKSQYDEMKKRMEEIDQISYNSTLYKLLKDNDISLN